MILTEIVKEHAEHNELSLLLPFIQEALQQDGRRLQFPAPLELAYQNETVDSHLCVLVSQGLLLLAGLFVFFLIDFYLGATLSVLLLRLGAVAAVFVLAGIVKRRLDYCRIGEVAYAGMALLLAASMVIPPSSLWGESHAAPLAVFMVFVGVIMQFQFRVALLLQLLILALYLLTMERALESWLSWACLVVTSGLCLITNYRMEFGQRRNYLLTHMQTAQSLKLRLTNSKLMQQSGTDALTLLANRRRFNDEFERAWKDAYRNVASMSLLFMDIDFFKRYNDTYGHAAGDEVLKAVAAVLRYHVHRPKDLAARLGGEEFVIMLPDTREDQAALIAERVRAGVQKLARLHGESPLGVVTLSIGVASVLPRDFSGDQNDLLNLADTALYAAKENGRNCVVRQSTLTLD